MRHHYSTNEGFNEAVIALGSGRPVKEFIKLTFKNRGDIYLFEELLPDVTRTELHAHLSLHKSGEIHYRSPDGPRERSPQKARSQKRGRTPMHDRPEVQEPRSGTVVFAEDFFYEGHRTVSPTNDNQLLVWCPYKLVVGSTLRWSVDLVNREDIRAIENVIRKRFPLGPQDDSHAISFEHQGRTVVVCMGFSGGTAVVDEVKVREVDAKKLEHHRIWLHDVITVT